MTRHFRGFGPGALAFFESLAAENTRDWFLAHKAEYEREAKLPALDLVADLCTAFADRGVPLHADPQRALFRIHRDVRFSRDKSPYKTHVSAVLTRSGEKRDQGLFYVQHGAGGSFAATGFYELEPSALNAFRAAIVADPDGWRTVEDDLAANGLTLGREGAAVRLPRGFRPEAVGDLTEALKLKSFVVRCPLTSAATASPGLVDELAAFVVAALPLLRFGWEALETT